MGDLPKGWNSKRIEDLCEFRNGIAFKSSWFCEKGTYQVLKLGNVKNGRVQLGSPFWNAVRFLTHTISGIDHSRLTAAIVTGKSQIWIK